MVFVGLEEKAESVFVLVFDNFLKGSPVSKISRSLRSGNEEKKIITMEETDEVKSKENLPSLALLAYPVISDCNPTSSVFIPWQPS